MSSKVNIAAVAVLLVACIGPVAAHAQSHHSTASMREHQPHAQSRHLKARVPVNAQGSAAASDVFSGPAARSGGRWFETDPDPRIRFEMNRDDRDRRAN